MGMWVYVLYGIFVGIIMRVIPIFHGYDSSDITRIVFYDDEKELHYRLVPIPHTCGQNK